MLPKKFYARVPLSGASIPQEDRTERTEMTLGIGGGTFLLFWLMLPRLHELCGSCATEWDLLATGGLSLAAACWFYAWRTRHLEKVHDLKPFTVKHGKRTLLSAKRAPPWPVPFSRSDLV